MLVRVQTCLAGFNDCVQAETSALREKYEALSTENRKLPELREVAPVLDAWADYVVHTGKDLEEHLGQRIHILKHYLNE